MNRARWPILCIAACVGAAAIARTPSSPTVRAQVGPGATPTPSYCDLELTQDAVEISCLEGCGDTDPPALPPIGDVALPPCGCSETWSLYAAWGRSCDGPNLASMPGPATDAGFGCEWAVNSGLYRRPVGTNGSFQWVMGLTTAYHGLSRTYEYQVIVADHYSNFLQLSKSCP